MPVTVHDLREMMAAFDALPGFYRRILREASYNIDPTNVRLLSASRLREALQNAEMASVMATYGSDHPRLAGRRDRR